MDDDKDKTSGKNPFFIYVAAALSALSGMLFGYDTGVISGAILFIAKAFSLSSTLQEIVVSAVLLGAVAGAALGGKLADSWGRRKVIIVAGFVFAFGAIGTAVVPTVFWLITGRVVVGMAIGVASFTAPMYISEVSPERVRGSLVSLNQLAITVGIVVSYLIGYMLAGKQDWRGMFALAAIPALVLAVGMLFMPKSPRWLTSRQQADKAKAVLKRIRPKGFDVEGEVREIQRSLSKQAGHGWKELLQASLRPALIVGMGLAVLQQVTGINTVIYYAPMIFQFAGIKSSAAAIFATVGVGVVNMIFTLVSLLLLDRVGRRPLLLIGSAGMVLSLVALGACFQWAGTLPAMGTLATASLMVYVASFAIGLGPVFWLLISEIYPLKVRGLAMSAATVTNWGANLIVALTFLTLVQAVGRPGTFWIYAAVGLGSWFFSFFLVPETKGRSLEQIEAHWQAGKHPRAMGGS